PAPGSTMKSGAIFLLGLLALWAHLMPASGQGVPGVCPRPVGPGICVEQCRGDDSCPPGRKCCGTGCGHACRRVVTPGEKDQGHSAQSQDPSPLSSPGEPHCSPGPGLRELAQTGCGCFFPGAFQL
uniref:WAP domain-containing protein n=1 Tax=Pelusios castaneus TaxID=367368 RepID=A0A8C8VME7_9SAUR